MLPNDRHFVLSSKNIPEALISNVRLWFGTNWFEFLGLATTVCNVTSRFEAPRRLSQAIAGPSSYRGLTWTSDITIHRITDPNCIFASLLLEAQSIWAEATPPGTRTFSSGLTTPAWLRATPTWLGDHIYLARDRIYLNWNHSNLITDHTHLKWASAAMAEALQQSMMLPSLFSTWQSTRMVHTCTQCTTFFNYDKFKQSDGCFHTLTMLYTHTFCIITNKNSRLKNSYQCQQNAVPWRRACWQESNCGPFDYSPCYGSDMLLETHHQRSQYVQVSELSQWSSISQEQMDSEGI